MRERRDQLRHPHYAAPELLATRPNELWSWDITKLLGPTKWTYYYLYVLLDVFSRHVVGWMLAHRELARLAEKLIAESCERQGIVPGQLTVHAAPVAFSASTQFSLSEHVPLGQSASLKHLLVIAGPLLHWPNSPTPGNSWKGVPTFGS